MTSTTQTAATTTMTAAVLNRRSTGFLQLIVRDMRDESLAATTVEAFAPIQAQIQRVRSILSTRPDAY